MNVPEVCIAVLKFKDEILILKRTSNREHSPNLWEAVSGFVEEGESPEEAALREVREETGLSGEIVGRGETFESQDRWGKWKITPFLVSVDSKDVTIDPHEHSEFKWISPKEIDKFKCVTDLKKDLKLLGLL